MSTRAAGSDKAEGLIRREWRSSRDSMRDVMRNTALRRVFYAFGGSLIGDGVFTLSAAVYAYRSGGATAVGILAVVRYLAIATIAPFASGLADQYDRKYVMVGSDLVRLVLVCGGVALTATHASRWYVYATIILVGMAGTAFRPAQASILPSLARRHDEVAASNAVSSTIESVGFFAGPAIAGFLLAFANVPVAFGFDALTFVWSAAFVASVRRPAPEEQSEEVRALLAREPDEAEPARSFLGRAVQGFRLIVADRGVSTLVLLYTLQCVVAGASAVFTVAIALRLLHIGSSGLGLMESTLGVGGLVGGFLALMLAERGRMATDFALGVIVWAAPLLIIAGYPHLISALAMMFLIGAANSVVDVNAITVLQHVVANEKLGRVLGALEAMEIAGMAVGSLVMTLLIHVTGLRTGLAIIGAVVSVLVLPGIQVMRRVDRVVFKDGVTHHPRTVHHHHPIHNPHLRAHLQRHLRVRVNR